MSLLADVSIASWTPSTNPLRIPEVQHNLRLITEDCWAQLEGLVQEARSMAERKKWVDKEDTRLRKKVEVEADRACHLVNRIVLL